LFEWVFGLPTGDEQWRETYVFVAPIQTLQSKDANKSVKISNIKVTHCYVIMPSPKEKLLAPHVLQYHQRHYIANKKTSSDHELADDINDRTEKRQ
jgi:hypothetical protein